MLGSQSGLAPAAECLGPVSQASCAPLPSLGAPCHAHPHRPQKHALLSLALPTDRSLLPPLLVTPSWPCCPVLAFRVPLCCREVPLLRRLNLCFDRSDSRFVPPGLRLARVTSGFCCLQFPLGAVPRGGRALPGALTSPLFLPLSFCRTSLACVSVSGSAPLLPLGGDGPLGSVAALAGCDPS